MATRGQNNIFSGEPMPVAPKIDDPELAGFVRNLLDYLRRLTGKLAQFTTSSGIGGAPAFAATLIVDQSNLGSALTIQWTNVVHRDIDVFDFTTPDTDIIIRQQGEYSVEVDIQVLKNVHHELTITVNGVTIDWSHSKFLPGDADLSYSFMVPVHCDVGDVIQARLDCAPFGGIAVEASGTRILVTKLGVST